MEMKVWGHTLIVSFMKPVSLEANSIVWLKVYFLT